MRVWSPARQDGPGLLLAAGVPHSGLGVFRAWFRGGACWPVVVVRCGRYSFGMVETRLRLEAHVMRPNRAGISLRRMIWVGFVGAVLSLLVAAAISLLGTSSRTSIILVDPALAHIAPSYNTILVAEGFGFESTGLTFLDHNCSIVTLDRLGIGLVPAANAAQILSELGTATGGSGGDCVLYRGRVGWPLRCAEWAYVLSPNKAHGARGAVVIESPPLVLNPGQWHFGGVPARVLPYRPMVWGLLGNTLIYGACVVFVVRFPPAVRRWRRRRTGCCAQCGYSMEGLSGRGCPECGFGDGVDAAT